MFLPLQKKVCMPEKGTSMPEKYFSCYRILLLFVFFEKRRLVAEIRIYEFTKSWQNGEEY
jgi:hypothetical protein